HGITVGRSHVDLHAQELVRQRLAGLEDGLFRLSLGQVRLDPDDPGAFTARITSGGAVKPAEELAGILDAKIHLESAASEEVMIACVERCSEVGAVSSTGAAMFAGWLNEVRLIVFVVCLSSVGDLPVTWEVDESAHTIALGVGDSVHARVAI